MKLNKYLPLIFFIAISQLAGLIGSVFTAPAISSWYTLLVKPSFSPPNWLFAPVWTTLFTLMGISAYFVWRKRGKNKSVRFALKLFYIHLVLNTLWSILFFGLKNISIALVEIVILWMIIVYIIRIFWKIDKVAAKLLLPYILWVSFATVLNYSLWVLN